MASISDQILDDMVADVGLITTAGGYQNDIASTTSAAGGVRWNLAGPDLSALPICVVYAPSEDKEQGPITKTQVRMPVFVDVYAQEPDAAASTEAYCKSLASDIERAMLVDRQRSTLAHDTKALGSEIQMAMDGSGLLLVEVKFELSFRHTDTNPETA